jgi:hypothetical protein
MKELTATAPSTADLDAAIQALLPSNLARMAFWYLDQVPNTHQSAPEAAPVERSSDNQCFSADKKIQARKQAVERAAHARAMRTAALEKKVVDMLHKHKAAFIVEYRRRHTWTSILTTCFENAEIKAPSRKVIKRVVDKFCEF